MIEDPELQRLFKVETDEHLARLDEGLLRLEQQGADSALLEELFREAHSMKGASRMLGLSKIESTAHELETLLNKARKAEGGLASEMLAEMTLIFSRLRGCVEQVLLGTKPTAPINEIPAEIVHGDTEKVVETFNTNQPFRIETVRVETRKLDDLLTLAGELSVIQGRGLHRLTLLDEMLDQWSLLDRSHRKLQFLVQQSESQAKADEKLSQQLQTDGETLAQLGERIKQARESFYEDGARLEMTSAILEESVHAARLLPLSGLFALFPRMVHDLAEEQSKPVQLLIEGGELNVDKRILEDMKDPLMHLLRNAIDHGIEAPDVREQQGKPRQGTIRLTAMRENNHVLLEVSDDGCGLDVESLRQAALRAGLHDPEILAAMTELQLQRLILLPGFSTSHFVTELSGRGIGMDVVQVNVERLKGDIHIDSNTQRGTTIQLRLPLSLATTRLLLVNVAGHQFGLPVEYVHSLLQVRDADIFNLEGRPAVDLAGQAIIAPCLAELLTLTEVEHSEALACVVIQVGDERMGLRVDDVVDEEEVLTKPLGIPLQRVRNVSGLTILRSGRVCVVLNPVDLLRAAHKLVIVSLRPRIEQTTLKTKSRILLAEDSVLVRVMEKRVLEAAGYEVVAAVDGLEAWNLLGSQSFAAVISDIMMPNMDGLSLTARIRQEPRYHELPVILVSSLASVEDKRRGLEVGASAYLPKPTFDQRVLLDTLSRLI